MITSRQFPKPADHMRYFLVQYSRASPFREFAPTRLHGHLPTAIDEAVGNIGSYKIAVGSKVIAGTAWCVWKPDRGVAASREAGGSSEICWRAERRTPMGGHKQEESSGRATRELTACWLRVLGSPRWPWSGVSPWVETTALGRRPCPRGGARVGLVGSHQPTISSCQQNTHDTKTRPYAAVSRRRN